MPNVRSVSIGVWVNVGARNEKRSNNGISHFIEHMAFKGTETRSAYQIAREIESVGGQLNAFTSREQTCFYAHLLDENLPQAIDVLADITAHSLFRDEDIEREKGVVLEEIRNMKDTPDELIFEYFLENIFPHHPLGYPILGTEKNVSRFTRETVVQFIEENYTLNNVVIAAAGNLEHKAVVASINDKFIFANDHPRRGNRKPFAPMAGLKVYEDDISQAHICLGGRGLPYGNPQKYALLVLNTILGGGMSSRLFQTIREKLGLAYSIYSFLDLMADTGLFGVYLATNPNQIEKCIDLVRRELWKLKKQPVGKKELQQTKNQLKGNLMLGLEKTSSRMNRIAKMEIYQGEFETLDGVLDNINRVSPEHIMEIARILFDEVKLYTTILKSNRRSHS